ncbi:MAG: DUF1648 domain-containing protein, partial [Candidatus Diapherotrites archaeon]|nr:DUF1648 domain-containing protein [Candidatus Diapherotrites archaeon]
LVLMFALSFYAFPLAPDKVATHWNAAGEANGFSDPLFGLFLLPVMSSFIYLLMISIPSIAVFKVNFKDFDKEYFGLRAFMMVFMLVVQVGIVSAALGFDFNMTLLIMPAISGLFFYIGWMLPKIKRNYFVGIRTPWTLSSDRVWKKTHEVGGKVFMLQGVILLFGVILPAEYFVWIILGPVLMSVFYLFWFSFNEFKKEKRK